MTMRDMTEAEVAAWNGMIDGDLAPLADVLEAEDGQLHPVLQRWLRKLISGTWHETDYRLKLDRHPDLKRASDGPGAQRKASQRDLEIALAMFRNGALTNCESACAAVKKKTGKGRATIMAAWSKKKGFIEFSLAHGILREDDQTV